MSPFGISTAVWGAWIGSFLVLETLGLLDVVPWNSLSWTVWQWQARVPLLSLAVAGGLFVLILHLVLPGRWPRKQQEREYTEGKR